MDRLTSITAIGCNRFSQQFLVSVRCQRCDGRALRSSSQARSALLPRSTHRARSSHHGSTSAPRTPSSSARDASQHAQPLCSGVSTAALVKPTTNRRPAAVRPPILSDYTNLTPRSLLQAVDAFLPPCLSLSFLLFYCCCLLPLRPGMRRLPPLAPLLPPLPLSHPPPLLFCPPPCRLSHFLPLRHPFPLYLL